MDGGTAFTDEGPQPFEPRLLRGDLENGARHAPERREGGDQSNVERLVCLVERYVEKDVRRVLRCQGGA